MAQIIKLRRSSTAGKVPTTSDLNLGELAINTNDGRIFFEKNDGSAAIKHVITSDSQTTGSIEVTGNVSGSSVSTGSFAQIDIDTKIGRPADSDTYIDFSTADEINFWAGGQRILSIDEAANDEVVIGDGGDVNFRAATAGEGYNFYVKSSNAGGIDNSVGVRTQSPQSVLDVTGDFHVSSHITASAHISASATSTASFGAGYIDGPSPRFGIGTTTPATALQVSGSLNISQQTIPSTVTTALDFADSNNFKVTLGTDTTLSSSNEASAIGSTGVVVLVQDGTGGRTVALPATWKTPKGQSISFDTGANDINIISYYVIDGSTVAINYMGDFS